MDYRGARRSQRSEQLTGRPVKLLAQRDDLRLFRGDGLLGAGQSERGQVDSRLAKEFNVLEKSAMVGVYRVDKGLFVRRQPSKHGQLRVETRLRALIIWRGPCGQGRLRSGRDDGQDSVRFGLDMRTAARQFRSGGRRRVERGEVVQRGLGGRDIAP